MRSSYKTEDYDFNTFKNSQMTTKEELIQSISRRKAKYEKEANTDTMRSSAFYFVLLTLLDHFQKRIEATHFLETLPDWWVYSYDINHQGATLNLEHVSEVTVNEKHEISSWIANTSFLLVQVQTKQLTVEQFSQMYGVEQVTVRQWIRRGKLRTASKQGNEWRISSLTDIRPRGYESAQYIWQGPLPDLPEEYEYLNNYRLATFLQDREDKTHFKIKFIPVNGGNTNLVSGTEPCELLCTGKEKEKLEMLMIAHPQIQYVDNY